MDRTLDSICTYADSLTYEELPPSTIHAAKHRFIDSLGCALGAYLEEPCKIARRLCFPTDSPLQARVIGSLARTTPDMAAFANSLMVRYLDFNDSIRVLDVGHPSDSIPAILAIGEAVHGDGKSLITAATLSYEIQVRFIEAFPFDAKGWDQPLYVILGCALGAGKILGLNKKQLANAVSLALVSNIALYQTRAGELSMWKAGAAGMAARQGVFAALMAREGMTGPDEPFEGTYGFFNQVTGGPINVEPQGGKGKQFAIERPNMKYFPVRDSCQLVALTALDLRKKNMPAGKIKSLLVKTYKSAYRTAIADPHLWAPQTRETADHSMPFCIAAALLDGDISVETFRQQRFLDKDVVDLLGRMKFEEDPEFSRQTPNKRNCLIEATASSGEKVTVHRIFTKEELEKGWTDEQVETKFMNLASTILTPAQRRASLDLLWKLEDLDDAGNILDNFEA